MRGHAVWIGEKSILVVVRIAGELVSIGKRRDTLSSPVSPSTHSRRPSMLFVPSKKNKNPGRRSSGRECLATVVET